MSLRVSIITSLYDADILIEGHLEDLIKQTICNDTELIIVNTASPGNEGPIICRYANYFQQLTYIYTPDRRTPAAALNIGAKIARGQYLTIANVDDRHRPDAFEIMTSALDTHPDIMLVYANSDITNIPNEIFGKHTKSGSLMLPPFQPHLVFQGCIVGPQPMFRREVHNLYGWFDETLEVASDFEMWMRMVSQGAKFLHIGEILGLYYRNPRGAELRNPLITRQETDEVRVRHSAAAIRVRATI